MEHNVILSIRGQQTIDNEEPEVTELVTEGTLSRSQIEDGRVTLLREGQVNSQMVFEEGRRHLSMYDTPYGALSIGIDTRRMKVRLGETGGDIEIDYAIEIDHAVAGENLFRINVKSRENRKLPQ